MMLSRLGSAKTITLILTRCYGFDVVRTPDTARFKGLLDF